MKEFFLILFFSKTVLLTTVPVDLLGEKVVVPEDPLKAITPGASIQVDISDYLTQSGLIDTGLAENQKLLKDLIPQGSIKAVLSDLDGNKIQLDHIGFSWSPDDTRVILTSSSGVPTDRSFNKVLIVSRIDLKGARIYWKNYVH